MKYLILFALFAASCNFTVKRSNHPTDIGRAKQLAEKYFAFVSERSAEKAASLFRDTANSREQYERFNRIDSALGQMTSYKLTNQSSNYESNNGVESAEYSLEYEVQYERGKTQEAFAFFLVSDSVRIIDHVVHQNF
jgi:hypothetical protein